MRIKLWHLGVVAVAALLALATFAGYTLASLRTQIATVQPQANATSKGRAAKSAVLANVRAVLPAVEQYNVDNIPGVTPVQHDPDFATSTTDSGYAGETAAGLRLQYGRCSGSPKAVPGTASQCHGPAFRTRPVPGTVTSWSRESVHNRAIRDVCVWATSRCLAPDVS